MTEKWDYLVPDDKLEDLIRNYCTDYTANARAGRYNPITGRDKEIDDCILILLQKGRKNVCFLAAAGVGKTAAVVGLAQRIVSGNVSEYLKGARVIEMDLARMASGTNSKAEFQDRFLPFCKGIAERYNQPQKTIIFIDEIHQIMPTCTASSYAGLSDTIKPYLTTGEMMIIGATTNDEYRLYVESDTALDRRFQKVPLQPPNAMETYSIMKALRPGLEKHHRINVTDETLMLVVMLAEEHMRKRNQPDKSIITLDASMAYHAMNHGIDQQLDRESIYYMVARETGLNRTALHDEKLIEKIKENVAIAEGKKKIDEEENKPKLYKPNENLQKVEFDEKYQAELAAQAEQAKKEILASKEAAEALVKAKSEI